MIVHLNECVRNRNNMHVTSITTSKKPFFVPSVLTCPPQWVTALWMSTATVVIPGSEHYINWFMLYTFFCVWLILSNIMFVRFISIVSLPVHLLRNC